MKTNRLLFLGVLIFSCALFCGISFAKENAAQKFDSTRHSFTISTKDMMADIAGKTEKYPKYTTQLINLANQNSQATRPNNVGQMSELIQEFPGNSYEQWVQWYIANYPDAVDQATDKTFSMIRKMQTAMSKIDRDMVQRWIRELVLTKTYAGLRFQESILKAIAKKNSTTYRLSRPDEESKGIDGYIGTQAVSIKPASYQAKPFLPEEIKAEIIYYKKTKGGIRVFYK